MIYRKCILPELFDIGHLFYSMASGDFLYHEYEEGELKEKKPKIKYQKWEQVDDRYDSLFGATYKVPVAEYPTNEDKIAITICGDKWLYTNKTVADMRSLNKWNSSFVHHCNYVNILTNTLEDELPIYFPNATIKFIGNYSAYNNTYNTLDDVIAYLDSLSEYPDYFIFNGVEGTYVRFNGNTNIINQQLSEIDTFCSQHFIKALCIYTTLPDIFNASANVYNYLYLQTYIYDHIQFFYLSDWFMKHTYIPEDFAEYGNNTNRTSQYKFPVAKTQGIDRTVLEWYLVDVGSMVYREVVYNTIKNYILETFLGEYNTHRECYYISLSHKDITSTTYGYYHGDKAKVYRPDSYPEKMITDIPIFPHPKYVFRSKYFQRNTPWNMFSNTGEFIAIALHTEFNEMSWMCEQKGSTCEDEGSKVRQSSVVTQLANLMPVLREREGGETRINPPVMQGTGTSWLTISDGDKEKYQNYVGFACPIEVYMSRDDYNFTITTRLHSDEGYQDIYQSIAAGKMLNSKDLFPLYVAGGTTGLKNDVYSYIPVAGVRTEVHGNVYDLSMENVALSNTTANHPTKFWNCIFSNFKVFSSYPGKWRSVFLHSQSATVVRDFLTCGPPVDHVTWLNEPIYNIGRTDANSFPVSEDLRYRVGNEWLNKHGFQYTTGKEPMNVEPWWYNSPLQGFRAFMEADWNSDTLDCTGVISSIFANWDWKIPCGEIDYPSTGQTSHNKFSQDRNNWALQEYDNWDSSVAYNKGNIVKYNSDMWQCVVAISSTGTFIDNEWSKINQWQSHTSYTVGNAILAPVWEASTVPVWQKNHDYSVGDITYFSGAVYRCLYAHTSGAISLLESANDWEPVVWQTNTLYYYGDVVAYGNTVYKCTVRHISGGTSVIEDMYYPFLFTGAKYLVIPCGWEERLYWYDGHYVLTSSTHNKINNTWQNDDVITEYEKNKLEFNKRRIKDKLFVLLEDNYDPVIKHPSKIEVKELGDITRYRIVLLFQFYTIHYIGLGLSRKYGDIVIHSERFIPSTGKIFNPSFGWSAFSNVISQATIDTSLNYWCRYYNIPSSEKLWIYDVAEGVAKFCTRAEEFASKFYKSDGTLVKFGDTVNIGSMLFFVGNFSDMWNDIKSWIATESKGSASLSSSSSIIHNAIYHRDTGREQIRRDLDNFGVKFASPQNVIPLGFPIDNNLDNINQVYNVCNYFYRWLMPNVLYTEVTGSNKVQDAINELNTMFGPFTQNVDGFKVFYSIKAFANSN